MYTLIEQSDATDLLSIVEQMSHLDNTDFDSIFQDQQKKIKLFSELETFCNLAYKQRNSYCM